MDIENLNQLTDPILPEHFVALAASCKFAGKTFEPGDTICYVGEEWECTAGAWQKTGKTC
jgi:hypothetical protein